MAQPPYSSSSSRNNASFYLLLFAWTSLFTALGALGWWVSQSPSETSFQDQTTVWFEIPTPNKSTESPQAFIAPEEPTASEVPEAEASKEPTASEALTEAPVPLASETITPPAAPEAEVPSNIPTPEAAPSKPLPTLPKSASQPLPPSVQIENGADQAATPASTTSSVPSAEPAAAPAQQEATAPQPSTPEAPIAPTTAETMPAKEIALPRLVNARKFAAPEGKAKIAIVITGLGINRDLTLKAIKDLPPEITLAFAPQARGLEDYIKLARQNGHEVLMMVPMEPISYPQRDPGPYTLLTSLTPDKNLERLRWVLDKSQQCVGMIDFMGTRFTASEAALTPILKEIHQRGYLFFDSLHGSRSVAERLAQRSGMAYVPNKRVIDAEVSKRAIQKNLEELERIAKTTGQVTAISFAYAISVEQLLNWLPSISSKDIVLTPVSALVKEAPKKKAE